MLKILTTSFDFIENSRRAINLPISGFTSNGWDIETSLDNPFVPEGIMQIASRLGDRFTYPLKKSDLTGGNKSWKWKAVDISGSGCSEIETAYLTDAFPAYGVCLFGDDSTPYDDIGGIVGHFDFEFVDDERIQEFIIRDYGSDSWLILGEYNDSTGQYAGLELQKSGTNYIAQITGGVAVTTSFPVRKAIVRTYNESGYTWMEAEIILSNGMSESVPTAVVGSDIGRPAILLDPNGYAGSYAIVQSWKVNKGTFGSGNDYKTTVSNVFGEWLSGVLSYPSFPAIIRRIEIDSASYSSTSRIEKVELWETSRNDFDESSASLLKTWSYDDLISAGMRIDGYQSTITLTPSNDESGRLPNKYIRIYFKNSSGLVPPYVSEIRIDHGKIGTKVMKSTCNMRWTTVGRYSAWQSKYGDDNWLPPNADSGERNSIVEQFQLLLESYKHTNQPVTASEIVNNIRYFISNSDIQKKAVICKVKIPEAPPNAGNINNVIMNLNIRSIMHPAITEGSICDIILVKIKDDKHVVIPTSNVIGGLEAVSSSPVIETSDEQKGANWKSSCGAENQDPYTWCRSHDKGLDGAGDEADSWIDRALGIRNVTIDRMPASLQIPFSNIEDFNWGDEIAFAVFIRRACHWDDSSEDGSFVISVDIDNIFNVTDLGFIRGPYFELEYDMKTPEAPSDLEVEAIDEKADDDTAPYHTGFVKLKWNKPDKVDNFSSYNIFRRTATSNWSFIGQITDYNCTKFIDRTDLDELTYYYYKVGLAPSDFPYRNGDDQSRLIFSNEVPVFRPQAYFITERGQSGFSVKKTFERVWLGVGWTYTPSEVTSKELLPPKYVHIDWGDDTWNFVELKLKRVVGFYNLTHPSGPNEPSDDYKIELDNTIGLEAGDHVSCFTAYVMTSEKAGVFKIKEKTSHYIIVNYIDTDYALPMSFTSDDIRKGTYVQQMFSHVYTRHGPNSETSNPQFFEPACAAVLENKYRSKFTKKGKPGLTGDTKIPVVANTPIAKLISVPMRAKKGNSLSFDLSDSDTLDESFSFKDAYCYEYVTKGTDLTSSPPSITSALFEASTGSMPSGKKVFVKCIVKDINGNWTPFSDGVPVRQSTGSLVSNLNDSIKLTVESDIDGTVYFFAEYDDTEELKLQTFTAPIYSEVPVDVTVSDLSPVSPAEYITSDPSNERWVSDSPVVELVPDVPAGSYIAFGRVRNASGFNPYGDCLVNSHNHSVPSMIVYDIVEPIIIDLSMLTDGYQTRDHSAGLSTSSEMYFGNKPVNISNVRKQKSINISGRAITRHTTHPIPEVNSWATAQGIEVGSLPDDILTLMYIEENKAQVKVTHEGRTWIYTPGAINRPRDANAISLYSWSLEAFEDEYEPPVLS